MAVVGPSATTIDGRLATATGDGVDVAGHTVSWADVWAFRLGQTASGRFEFHVFADGGVELAVAIDGSMRVQSFVDATLARLPDDALGRAALHGDWALMQRHLPGSLPVPPGEEPVIVDRNGIRSSDRWVHWNNMTALRAKTRRGRLTLEVTTPSGDIEFEALAPTAETEADLRALSGFLNGERPETRPIARAGAPPRRRRRVGPGTALVALIVLAGVGVWAWPRLQGDDGVETVIFDTADSPTASTEASTATEMPATTESATTTSATAPASTPEEPVANVETDDSVDDGDEFFQSIAGRSYEAGQCVWVDPDDVTLAQADIVGCDDVHHFEVTGEYQIQPEDVAQYPGYPTDADFDRIDERHCRPMAVAFLGAEPLADGLFYSGAAVVPLRSTWEQGGRKLTCGFQIRHDGDDEAYVPTAGSVLDVPRDFAIEAGTCLIDASFGRCPVAMTETVTISTGMVSLVGLVGGPGDVDGSLAEGVCGPLAEEYLGERFDDALFPVIFSIDIDVWAAGVRRVPCGVGTDGEVPLPLVDPSSPPRTGTCLGTFFRRDVVPVLDPGDCDRAHLAEVVATITLDEGTPHPEDDATVADDLRNRCRPLVVDYLGGVMPERYASGLRVADPTDWANGQRYGSCLVVRADGGFLGAGVLQAAFAGNLTIPSG